MKSPFGYDPPFTLVEGIAVIAILGTLGALLVPAVVSARRSAARHAHAPQQQPAEPEAASWYLRTRQHDGHWWVISVVGESHTPVHHPDCPCKQRSPEAQ